MNFFTNNATKYKVWRTIIQACISFFIVDGGANLLELLAHIPMADWVRTLLFGLIMAILAGLMPYIGRPVEKEDLPDDYFEGEETHD